MSGANTIGKLIKARQETYGDTPARRRIEALFDTGTFVEIGGFAQYNGKPTGVVCGYGSVLGAPVYAFAQDSEENGGAISTLHAKKIVNVIKSARKVGVPIVGIYDNVGAAVAQGTEVLEAYGEIFLNLNNMSGVIPQISVVLGKCTGISAVMASSADFTVMSREAQLFTDIDDEKGNNGEDAAKSGLAHIVAEDEKSACEAARKLVSLLPLNNLASLPTSAFSEPFTSEVLAKACEDINSAEIKDIVGAVCDSDSIVEILKDFGTGAYAAVCGMGGYSCGVVGLKGGKLDSDSCAKIAKLVSVCDAYQIPVVTFVNSDGIGSGENSASVRDMARLIHVYAEATTPKVSVIVGGATGSAYIAFASAASGADYTVAWPNAVISALEPKTAVAFLHSDEITKEHDRNAVVADYIENSASAYKAAEGGFIDDVIDPAVTRNAVLAALDLLSAKRVERQPKKHSNMPI